MRILIIDDLEAARLATEGAVKSIWQDAEVIAPDNLQGCSDALSEGADLIFLDFGLTFPGERPTSGLVIANETLKSKGTRILINSNENPKMLRRLMDSMGFTNYLILEDTPKTSQEIMIKFLQREKENIESGLNFS